MLLLFIGRHTCQQESDENGENPWEKLKEVLTSCIAFENPKQLLPLAAETSFEHQEPKQKRKAYTPGD